MTPTKPSPWNIANVLTVARLIMVPAFVVVLLVSAGADTGNGARWRLLAWLVFTVALFTDYLDGVLARSRNLVTEFGKLADPIADKALTGAAFIGLAWFDLAPWWAVITILVREIAVTVLRFWLVRRFGAAGVMAAQWGGKAKTLLQGVAICWLLLPWNYLGLSVLKPVGWWLLMAAVILTVVSGVDYLRHARAIATRAQQPGAQSR